MHTLVYHQLRHGKGLLSRVRAGVIWILSRNQHAFSEYLLWASFRHCSAQFSSVAQLCLTLFDPMDGSMPGFPVHHQLPEFAQTHVHWDGDAIQPSHPLLSPNISNTVRDNKDKWKINKGLTSYLMKPTEVEKINGQDPILPALNLASLTLLTSGLLFHDTQSTPSPSVVDCPLLTTHIIFSHTMRHVGC